MRNNQITTFTITDTSNMTLIRANNNKKLTYLKCSSNALTSLEVTGCTALKELYCYFNYNLPAITGLESCTPLTYLDCDGCAITDLSALNNFSNIETVFCRNNKITSLTISEKTKFKKLYAKGNTLLKTLTCNNNVLTVLE